MRRRALLIVATIILTVLVMCVITIVLGIGWYALTGALDVPYHDQPPTPSTLP
jgi:hypothetical protein